MGILFYGETVSKCFFFFFFVCYLLRFCYWIGLCFIFFLLLKFCNLMAGSLVTTYPIHIDNMFHYLLLSVSVESLIADTKLSVLRFNCFFVSISFCPTCLCGHMVSTLQIPHQTQNAIAAVGASGSWVHSANQSTADGFSSLWQPHQETYVLRSNSQNPTSLFWSWTREST